MSFAAVASCAGAPRWRRGCSALRSVHAGADAATHVRRWRPPATTTARGSVYHLQRRHDRVRVKLVPMMTTKRQQRKWRKMMLWIVQKSTRCANQMTSSCRLTEELKHPADPSVCDCCWHSTWTIYTCHQHQPKLNSPHGFQPRLIPDSSDASAGCHLDRLRVAAARDVDLPPPRAATVIRLIRMGLAIDRPSQTNSAKIHSHSLLRHHQRWIESTV